MWWTTSSGSIELNITKDQAARAAHMGQCDADVFALSQEPVIRRQLAKLDQDQVRDELREWGAWDEDEDELKSCNDAENLQRLLWLACCDIAERN